MMAPRLLQMFLLGGVAPRKRQPTVSTLHFLTRRTCLGDGNLPGVLHIEGVQLPDAEVLPKPQVPCPGPCSITPENVCACVRTNRVRVCVWGCACVCVRLYVCKDIPSLTGSLISRA